MPPALYLDDCADDDTLAALLRWVGHQVHTPRVAGTSGVSDSEHLDYAARQGYTLLTKDPDDFIDLHNQWKAMNRTHQDRAWIRSTEIPTDSPIPYTYFLNLEAISIHLAI